MATYAANGTAAAVSTDSGNPSLLQGAMYVNHSSVFQQVRDFQLLHSGSWIRVQKAWINDGAGNWRRFYTYVPDIYTTTTITFPTSATSINNAPSGSTTVSGTVVTQGTNPTAVPTGSSVELWNGGTKLTSTTTAGDGSFSFTFTPSTVGSYGLTVKFPLSGVYQPSSATVPTITANTTTSASSTYPSYGVIGTAYTVTGTVTGATGETPSAGTVTLYVNNASRATATVGSGGSYTLSYTPGSSDDGTWATHVSYGGSGNFESCSESSSNQSIYQPTPAAPTGFTVTSSSTTYTSVTLRVNDMTDIKYMQFINQTLNQTINVNSTGSSSNTLSATFSGLSDLSSYTFACRAFSDNPVDNQTWATNGISLSTGTPGVHDVHSAVTFNFSSNGTGSWRSADGWSYQGTNLAQGYYTASYGAYYGCGKFNYGSMQNTIDNWGTGYSGRWQHISCSGFRTYLTRQSGSGSSSAVNIGWYQSGVTPGSGGQPSIAEGPVTSSPAGLSAGSSGWLTMPYTNWVPRILSGQYQSLVLYQNDSSDYSIYNGGSGFQISMDLSWDWWPTPQQNTTWSTT